MKRWLGAVLVVAACGGQSAATNPAPVAGRCPVVDTTAGVRAASIFIDGKLVEAGRTARLTQEFPETFALDGDDPPALAALPAGKIDLLQFVRGVEAETDYRLCPGGVAFLITTRAGP